jgi:hypothetical protein
VFSRKEFGASNKKTKELFSHFGKSIEKNSISIKIDFLSRVNN